MGRQWRVPERGRKRSKGREERRKKVGGRKTKKHLGSPQRKGGDVGPALLPCEKFANFRNG